MANLLYCPNCKFSRECTKKGFNAAGEQLYYCKTCKTKFTLITGPKANKTTAPKVNEKKAPTKKVATPKVKGTTEIIVNNNTIKTVPGLLTLDQAFDMASSYFKEIAKEKATEKSVGDKKVITFKVTSGGKG